MYIVCDGTIGQVGNTITCTGTLQTITEQELVSKVVEQVPPPFPELEPSQLTAIMAATTLFLAVCWMGKNFMGLLKNTKTE
ncbi:hypothetical protein [Pseudoteredinibacter isoporae]|uniref:Uncharacterized protein n=1 Tax=Pseudoteredinibacter isoporae TaxID=570281 RepID=A0A7X0JYP7_9GAMM|nr:hypothetical protein [Pseudoteredinibacter isoporae]MBB6523901.1 hypothetical protein [Pseudoteredinibacter isoporae]NHO89400.1 hypothetical protein [Pseudoteredinibacter isoporae]NIB22790.1 hypothetical protein [Pseudoteredinibacter isoporae]